MANIVNTDENALESAPDVGARLRLIRQQHGFSQRELARRAGLTNTTISLIEKNKSSPSISSLKKVLDGIPMSLAEFFALQESVEIRSAAPADIEGVHAIYALEVAQGTASFELIPPDIEEIRRRFETLKGGGYPYLVAAGESGAVVGYAYAGPYRTRPAYQFSIENSVYVADRARRSGIASRLLDALITECELLGFRQMVAIIGDSTHVASIELHRKAGFRLVGNLENVGYKFERWLDSVIMQRALGPGASTAPDPRR